MERATIIIAGEPYQVGFSFRAIREFEKQSGKSISECTTTWDHLLFFYSTLKALNSNFSLSLEQFADILDDNPALLAQFTTSTTGSSEPEPVEQPKKKGLFGLWTLSLLLSVSPVLVPLISMIVWISTSFRLLGRLIAKIGKKHGSRSLPGV